MSENDDLKKIDISKDIAVDNTLNNLLETLISLD